MASLTVSMSINNETYDVLMLSTSGGNEIRKKKISDLKTFQSLDIFLVNDYSGLTFSFLSSNMSILVSSPF